MIAASMPEILCRVAIAGDAGFGWSGLALARPDHHREADCLHVIAVAAMDFEQFVTAMKSSSDRWRRLIRISSTTRRTPSRHGKMVNHAVELSHRHLRYIVVTNI
jgi:hypothetical protein